MPTSTREILLGRYHYDPLDRLVDCTPFDQTAIQRYYCKTRLTTELQGAVQRTIVQHDDQLLAQQQSEGEGDKTTATLLATDQQRSILNALDATQLHPLDYTPYGHRPVENGLLSLLGFTGERPDSVTGHYHLGNGYRQFNPVLMRFNSPDSWSPFGEGGLNAYAYCAGDPVNKIDPNGHAALGLLLIAGGIGSIVGAGIVIAKGKGETESVIGGVALGILGLTLMMGGGASFGRHITRPRSSIVPVEHRPIVSNILERAAKDRKAHENAIKLQTPATPTSSSINPQLSQVGRTERSLSNSVNTTGQRQPTQLAHHSSSGQTSRRPTIEESIEPNSLPSSLSSGHTTTRAPHEEYFFKKTLPQIELKNTNNKIRQH
ncbi:RHS repeat-associated core domain-containing protein [Pseudomonas fluorescens]|uniref:RHS repeat-associated core domain-containing protein n=1 Tax=Pseudomonas fluorescens TaxID=294 RepID=UPI001240B275|nr:RHS repeat-associated core domain-containing protein [Pseudomonas fluorescens]VVM83684.1 hypothetical protein PS639_02405 [Pseudomonas fluorescens]